MGKILSTFKGKKILIAEDYFINQEVTQAILELMEFTVDIAENGREALEMYESNAYDAILMDVQMPEMDGFQTTAEIRKKEKNGKRIPIIALTANAMSGDREKCLNAGMDDYLSKPIEASKLEEILKKYIPN
ncbi:response regulator [Waddlia chondrophila]|nr:response regulator [Waddlia chondrophila]